MARNSFRAAAREVAAAYSQFSAIAAATRYATRDTFISCCLQAGISLATVAAWCGTSIQMISATHGRIIRRHERAPPVALDAQFRAGKVEALSLLTDGSRRAEAAPQGGSTGRFFDPSWTQRGSTGGSTGPNLSPARRRKVGD